MNFDKNTVIGFALLAVLLLGFFYFNQKSQVALQLQRDKEKRIQDSIAKLNAKTDSTKNISTSATLTDSASHKPKPITTGGFDTSSPEEISVVENELMKVGFTTKGGQIKWVEFKKYLNADKSSVKIDERFIKSFSYSIATSANEKVAINNLIFSKPNISTSADGEKIISFVLSKNGDTTNSIIQQYSIKPNQYMIGANIKFNGSAKNWVNNSLNIVWDYAAKKLEKDLAWERGQTEIGYFVKDDYDYNSISKDGSKEWSDPIKWVAVKQQFFSASVIADKNFSSGKVEWKAPFQNDSTGLVSADVSVNLPLAENSSAKFSFYYGPNDYAILKKYNIGLENNVNLGTGIYAFVKYINRYVVLPIFNLFKQFTTNYGIIIMLLTIVIRLLISPLTYSSYLSGAKMKVLRPEINLLKEKYGKDQQQFSVEQMKLFREAGVNPLAGCIPALLQIPIFFALYSFFNSNLDLRGQSFLWAKDLSVYDAVIHWSSPVIPFIGTHISLFTIASSITMLLISVYGMSLTPDQNNPMLKYMPYIMPVMLIFVFNKMPSALTWYYTVSNVATLGLQFVIQNYIIDHDKILAKIEENKKKPKKKSKFQERLEQMQQSQAKIKEMQAKVNKKK